MDSSDPSPDAVLAAVTFDETMDRARARVAAMGRAADELARLGTGSPQGDADMARRRRRVLEDLALDLGG